MQRRTPRTLNFTKAGIDNLPPPESGREYHYDVKIPGLSVCVTAAGRKTFYVVRRVGGKVEYIRIGGWPDFSVENARKQAEQINGTVAKGINPNDARRAARKAVTLGSVFEDYIERPTRTKAKRPKGARTKHEYRLLYNQHLKPIWEERALESIERREIEALHNRIGADTPYAANRVLALINGIYNTALDDETIKVNPAARIMPFEEKSRARRLETDEMPKFWAALEAEPSAKVRDFILLALLTGQRRSNVLAMKWVDLNLNRKVWNMPHTKTGALEVPLSEAAVVILNRRILDRDTSGPADPLNTAHRLPSEYVLPGRHGRGHLRDPNNAWKEVKARAGLKDLRIHDLRRSLGSWQTDTGASRAIVGRLLGHSREETTAIYGRVGMQPVRESLEIATAAMMAAAKSGTREIKNT